MHRKVQKWVWQQGWRELRPAQVAAAGPVVAGATDVIVSAATAAGKTEAVFLPVCSVLLDEPASAPGIRVLYVSPLKALINDQHSRLAALCADLDIAVHRWHGDVASSQKSAVVKDPHGMLLITPESLEALFVRHGAGVTALFGTLRYVVVDELHAFIGTERGAQLQSLLHRIELRARRRIPRLAMSATLGDLKVAADFLRPGHGDAVTTVIDDDDHQELRLQLRGYLETPPRLDAAAAEKAEQAGGEVTVEDVTPGDAIAVAEHLFTTLRGTDNLVFANSRTDVETYADLLRAKSERSRVPNAFFPHHGSLAKDLREHVEAELKAGGQPVTAICTSTLEMGIDIGDVASIAQIGAPPSVASLRQRLGRSGRRGGPAVLRLYVAEREIDEKATVLDWLRFDLVQSIAMVQLLLRGWIEPPATDDLHLSTLVQQVFSVIAEHGGVRPGEAYGALCGHGPFQRVTPSMFAELLSALGGNELITQMDDGTLLLDVAGERIVNHYSFYTAFSTPEEYRLVADGRQLGSLPIDFPLLPGMLLVFAGRRWKVLSVDDAHKVIDLEKSRAGRPPRFTPSVLPIHAEVHAEMLRVFSDDDFPVYLDERARDLLAEARANFTRLRLDTTHVVAAGQDTALFPWARSRVADTVAAVLGAGGLSVQRSGPAVLVTGVTPRELADELAILAPGGAPDPVELAAAVGNKASQKYDPYLGDRLLDVGYAARSLDPEGAWQFFNRALADLRTTSGVTQ
ncbi:MAG TPA: DEAD/DEAH box helicase [Frankiaceae bacterium]|nr:DEAD/DEAH box helicase [Frankiaceae bacterium]